MSFLDCLIARACSRIWSDSEDDEATLATRLMLPEEGRADGPRPAAAAAAGVEVLLAGPLQTLSMLAWQGGGTASVMV